MTQTTMRHRGSSSGQSAVPLIIILSLLSTVTALLQTMVVPVLGKMSRDLEVSTAAIGWVVTINLLAAAVVTPILSKSGDLHGRRKLLLGVVVAVGMGSLMAAVTSSFAILILARIIQGASFCLFPLSIGILRDQLDAQRLPLGMSFLTGSISVGAGIGLVLTGILTHGDRDYRNIFWFTLVIAVTLGAMAWRIVPADRPREAGRVDWIGAFALGLGLVLLLLALTQGNDWGWTGPATLGCAAAAVVTLVIWWWIEKRVREPLVPPAMMRHTTLLSANVIGFFIGFGMFLVFLGITALVQVPDHHGHGFSATVLETSLIYLLPAASIGIIASPLGGLCVTRFGGRATLLFGSLLGSAGYLQLLLFHSASWHVILGGVITNAAFSIGFAAVPAVVVTVVRAEETALANAVTSISRSAGSALGSALVVALVASHLMSDNHPSEIVFQWAFAIGLASMVTSVIIAFVGIPRHRFTTAPPVALEDHSDTDRSPTEEESP